jgi:hypothetical protein
MQYVLQWRRPRESDMKFGYARVSTADQHLDMQLQALRLAGCTRIFQEQRSGAHRDRPELLRLLDQLREGDTVVVWRLDRLARSTRDLLDIVACLQERGAGFQSLAEPWADTTSAAGRMVMTVFAGIADYAESGMMQSVVLKPRCSLGFGDPVLRIIPVPDRDLARSYGTDHNVPGLPSPRREAISASGALNCPRHNSGGITASTASSFSDGLSRRQVPERRRSA